MANKSDNFAENAIGLAFAFLIVAAAVFLFLVGLKQHNIIP